MSVVVSWIRRGLPGAIALLATACEAIPLLSTSPSPTPINPVPVVSPSPTLPPTVASPSPIPDAYKRALEKAASATTLEKAAQTSADWELVVSRWQQAIEYLKAVPPGSTDKTIAQRTLPTYQKALAQAQALAKQPPKRPAASSVATRPTGEGIPLIAGSQGVTGNEENPAATIQLLNQQQSEFYAKQKRFATNLTELQSTVAPKSGSYIYQTSGNRTRALTTALSQVEGQASYRGAVFVTLNGTQASTSTIVCRATNNSRTPPAVVSPSDNGEARCAEGGEPVEGN